MSWVTSLTTGNRWESPDVSCQPWTTSRHTVITVIQPIRPMVLLICWGCFSTTHGRLKIVPLQPTWRELLPLIKSQNSPQSRGGAYVPSHPITPSLSIYIIYSSPKSCHCGVIWQPSTEISIYIYQIFAVYRCNEIALLGRLEGYNYSLSSAANAMVWFGRKSEIIFINDYTAVKRKLQQLTLSINIL